jgi:hypothetical protein
MSVLTCYTKLVLLRVFHLKEDRVEGRGEGVGEREEREGDCVISAPNAQN